MLLVTLGFENYEDKIVADLNQLRELYKKHNAIIGFSESMEVNTHFIKIFCDEGMDSKLIKKFYVYISEIIFQFAVEEFTKKHMEKFLEESYSFLSYEEIEDVKRQFSKTMKNENQISDNTIWYINKINSMISKIQSFIKENKEININGFITFRMKELNQDFIYILDKIVDKCMVEKEYSEFIKLLNYFVEIQDAKIEEVNIIINNKGGYVYKDGNNIDIKNELFCELFDIKYNENINEDDMLISGLITNSPKKIVIHCAENVINGEIIDTIVKVFGDRVEFCNKCKLCSKIKNKYN